MKVMFKIAEEADVPGMVKLCNECFEENNSVEKAVEIFRKNHVNQVYVIGVTDTGETVAHTLINILPLF